MIKEEKIHSLFNWTATKIKFDNRNQRPFFTEREVWWTALGENVGVEMNGKGGDCTRPVIILKKCNQNSAFIIPLATAIRKDYGDRVSVYVADKDGSAVFSQARTISNKRLIRLITKLDPDTFQTIKENYVNYLL